MSFFISDIVLQETTLEDAKKSMVTTDTNIDISNRGYEGDDKNHKSESVSTSDINQNKSISILIIMYVVYFVLIIYVDRRNTNGSLKPICYIGRSTFYQHHDETDEIDGDFGLQTKLLQLEIPIIIDEGVV